MGLKDKTKAFFFWRDSRKKSLESIWRSTLE